MMPPTTRSRRAPFAFLALSALLGGLGLLTLWVAVELRPRHPDVVYTVTPNPATGLVRMQVDLTGLAPGRVFFLAPASELGPTSGPPALPDFGARSGGESGVPIGPHLWWGQADSRGRLSLRYDATPHSADARHALLAGARAFAVPLHSDPRSALFERDPSGRPAGGRPQGCASRIRVRFVLPPGWDAYTPWAESAPEVEVPGGSFARLRESLVALGDYLPHEFEAAGTRVEFVTRGTDPAREDELVSLVRGCLAAHAAAVGPNPHPRLLVIADHPYRGDQADGEAVLNAAYFELSGDPGALRSHSLGRIVSHELFHLWNGGALDLDAPELRWFAEGVTEYYALRGLEAAGRLTPGAMADELARCFDRLRGNPWADSSLAALGRGYRSEPSAWQASYAKGALAAWALDLRLASAGGLDPLIRALVREGRRPDLPARLAAFDAGAAAGLLDSLSSARFQPAMAAELAAHGLRLERRRSNELTLGFRFFRPGTTEVVDLDPEGPAARRGVREGDRVVEVQGRPVDDLAVLAEALADAGRGPVAVGLDRQGRRVDVVLVPGRALVTRVVEAPSPELASQVPAPGEIGAIGPPRRAAPVRGTKPRPAPD